MIYFLGHGARWNSQDYLIGISGKATSVKQIQKTLQKSRCAKQYTLVLDCCRNVKEVDAEPDVHERSSDINMTIVYGAVEGAVAPDVLGKTLTSCIVKLLKRGGKTPVKDLQEELRITWNETQMEHSKKIQHIPTVDYSPKFPNTLFPCD